MRGVFRLIVSDASKPLPPAPSDPLAATLHPWCNQAYELPSDLSGAYRERVSVEGWDFQFVGCRRWFLELEPGLSRSDLIRDAQWIGEERPPFGTYEIQG